MLYPELPRAIAITPSNGYKMAGATDPGTIAFQHFNSSDFELPETNRGDSAANLHVTLCEKGPFRTISSLQLAALLRGLGAHKLLDQMPDGQLIRV